MIRYLAHPTSNRVLNTNDDAIALAAIHDGYRYIKPEEWLARQLGACEPEPASVVPVPVERYRRMQAALERSLMGYTETPDALVDYVEHLGALHDRPVILAIDFDGCLCEDRSPDIGAPHQSLIQSLIRLSAQGHRLILHTCRAGERVEEAVRWCAEHGLHFDAVNANLPERIAEFGSDTRKISADLYLDDKACLCRP